MLLSKYCIHFHSDKDNFSLPSRQKEALLFGRFKVALLSCCSGSRSLCNYVLKGVTSLLFYIEDNFNAFVRNNSSSLIANLAQIELIFVLRQSITISNLAAV